MPSIVLDNFRTETTEFVESDGKNNLHAQIDAIPPAFPKGDIFNPPRIDTTYGINYPLYGWNNSFSLLDMTQIVPSISWDIFVNSCNFYIGSPYYTDCACIVDKKGNVVLLAAGGGGTYATSKETPSNPNSVFNCVVHFNEKIVLTSYNYSDRFYYINNDLSGSWSSVTFTAGRYVIYPIVFNNNLFLGQENPSGGQMVSRYNTSFSLVGSLIINTSGKIMGITNYNNQYLAIFLRENNKDFMILWNGDVNSSSSDRYYLPARLISSISSNGYLFVLLEEINGFSLYYFTGNNFKLLFKNTKYPINNPSQINMKNIIKDWIDYLVISTGNRTIFYSIQKDELFGYGQNNAMTCPSTTNYFIEISRDATPSSFTKKWVLWHPMSLSGLLFKNLIDLETSNYMGRSFFYRSNWIVLGKRIKINNIKLYYTNETPDYYLIVRVGYIDEKTGGSLQTKDYSFLQSQLPASYKEFQVNIECTKFFVMIWSDPNINTVSKSVKRAIIDYDILE